MNDEDLRDLFAACALIGIAKDVENERKSGKWCYEMADAMLEAKYAGQEEPEVGIAAVVKRTRKKNGTHA